MPCYKVTTFLFLFLLSLGILNAKPLFAVEYGSIGGRPAYPRADNPRTDSIFIHTIGLGKTVTDGINVMNNTGETKTLLVYAVDSIVSSDGAFACAQQVDEKKDVSSWIKLDKKEVTLAPNTTEVVGFALSTPMDTDVGEHNGCLVVQEKKDAPVNTGNGIALSFRTAIRVVATIPGTIVKKLAIQDFKVIKDKDGAMIFQPYLSNTGNVSVDTTISINTKTLLGTNIKEEEKQFIVLRGQTATWNIPVSKKPYWGGLYKSELTVKYNADTKEEIGVKSDIAPTILTRSCSWYFIPPQPLPMAMEIGVGVILSGLLCFESFKPRKEKKNTKRTTIKSSASVPKKGSSSGKTAVKRVSTKTRVVTKK